MIANFKEFSLLYMYVSFNCMHNHYITKVIRNLLKRIDRITILYKNSYTNSITSKL
jgi:hypothetical protein